VGTKYPMSTYYYDIIFKAYITHGLRELNGILTREEIKKALKIDII